MAPEGALVRVTLLEKLVEELQEQLKYKDEVIRRLKMERDYWQNEVRL